MNANTHATIPPLLARVRAIRHRDRRRAHEQHSPDNLVADRAAGTPNVAEPVGLPASNDTFSDSVI